MGLGGLTMASLMLAMGVIASAPMFQGLLSEPTSRLQNASRIEATRTGEAPAYSWVPLRREDQMLPFSEMQGLELGRVRAVAGA